MSDKTSEAQRNRATKKKTPVSLAPGAADNSAPSSAAAPGAALPPASMQSWYSIRAAGQDTAEVLIYGDIGESWSGESVTAQKFADDLKAVADKKLVVRINSYGGSVADGATIYNAIRRHPLEKITAVDGVAVSIASLIAMAGDTVQMAANTLMMIHAPWGGAVGNATFMREYADVLDTYAKAMAASYASQTGKPVDEMLALLSDGKDHWFTADEALQAGFADEIIDGGDNAATTTAAAAQYRAQAFARFHVPAAVAAAFNPKENTMPTKQPKNTPATEEEVDDTETTVEDKAKVVALETAAAKRERERIAARNAEIRALAKPFAARDGVQALLDRMIDDPDVTLAQAREQILAKLGEGAEPLNVLRLSGGADERDKRIVGRTEALLGRVGRAQPDASNPFRGEISLMDMARNCLEAAGVNTRGMDALTLSAAALTRDTVRGAQTGSDFPVILENTMHKLVLTGYEGQPQTYSRFCRLGDVSDFRAWNRIVPGLIGNLDTTNEHGEYKNKAVPDGVKNPVQATRKGNIIQITPEVLINDDTGYIVSMASGLGAAGNRAIERAVYAVLNANAALSDTVALFHATHANLAGSGAVPSVTTLDAARVALVSQKAPGTDAEYLNIAPPYIAVVPLAQGLNMRAIAKAVYDPDTANKMQKPNPVAGMFSDVVDSPWLSGTAWYLFADPNVAPVIEVVFLNGQRSPRLTQEENFRTGGLAWRVELPFGVGAVDYRGGFKNPGA